MIFISLGTQKFQFNRLLKMIDDLIEENVINDEVFAQIGYSDYTPKNYKYVEILNQLDFSQKINESTIFITHGGVGSINTGLRKGKKIIALPRDCSFGEHVDNHQYEFTEKLYELGYILKASNKIELIDAFEKIKTFVPLKYHSEYDSSIEGKIIDYIENL